MWYREFVPNTRHLNAEDQDNEDEFTKATSLPIISRLGSKFITKFFAPNPDQVVALHHNEHCHLYCDFGRNLESPIDEKDPEYGNLYVRHIGIKQTIRALHGGERLP
ncbi:hypothetical protein FVEN_g12839 [Fusarium venenatum]|uniref:Uncharacterized protein n=1 Tax=Fusarium venenatum TaxID=56646 RepID=A0A2L2T8W4_9HYPO|nr:uncharacterized protein FVRRES_03864 [Fusarium venenatum]KAG8356399.1 hypothetical protein FVEN_g12839 [Fusarium venenatum]CEI67352.1 unnamed protein product [Fusarium venenatum]